VCVGGVVCVCVWGGVVCVCVGGVGSVCVCARELARPFQLWNQLIDFQANRYEC